MRLRFEAGAAGGSSPQRSGIGPWRRRFEAEAGQGKIAEFLVSVSVSVPVAVPVSVLVSVSVSLSVQFQ